MLRNFLTLTTGELAARGLHAVAIVLLARILKPEGLSVFELAIAISSYAVLAVQQGFDHIGIREGARHADRIAGLLPAVIRMRLVFATVAGGLMLLGAWITDMSALGVLLAILAGSCFTNALTPRWAFLAQERAAVPAAASILAQIVFLGTVAIFVRGPGDAWLAALGWVGGEALAAVLLWLKFGRSAEGSPKPYAWRKLLTESAPVTASLVLGQLMYNFDTLALASLGYGSEIGLYQSAYRCVTVFAPVLVQLQASILPSLVRTHRHQADFGAHSKRIVLQAAGSGLGFAIILFLASSLLIEFLFGSEYRASATYLRWLAWTVPAQVVRAVARQILIADGRQREDTRNAALAAGVNIAFDFALIPHWGALGCAISTLCSATVLMVTSWRSAR